jgi:hypothetical protein
VEVWKLDMAEFKSVTQFAERCDKLERLDVFVSWAQVTAGKLVAGVVVGMLAMVGELEMLERRKV